MKFSKLWICLMPFIVGFVFGDEKTSNEIMEECLYRLSEASNLFGFELLQEFVKEKQMSMIISPISIYTTFGLIYLGSEGTTEKELSRTLKYSNMNLTKSEVLNSFRELMANEMVTDDYESYELDIASAIFINSYLGLKSSYKTAAKDIFRASVEAVDFSSGSATKVVARINNFVRNVTKNKISNIIAYLDPSADLVAVNALYFKSPWNSPFPDGRTENGTFYNGGVSPTYVPMMKRNDYFGYYEDDQFRLIFLDFWARQYYMLIILPQKMDGLLEVEKSITPTKINHILANPVLKPLQISIPKFKISYSNELARSMQSMGAREIFQPNRANLTGIVDEQTVAVGEILHKAVIEFNEEGVEASAATAIFSFKSMPLDDPDAESFIADHPFMFLLIDERTNLIVLMGRVWNL